MVVPLISIRPLRIAQIAPLYESVPPRLYGGTERIVAYLTDALVRLGHDVTLFASGEARTRRGSCRCASRPSGSIRRRSSRTSRRTSRCCTRCASARAEFDVLHFHVDLLHFPFFEELAARTVTTLHGRLDLKDLPEAIGAGTQYPAGLDLRRPAAAACRRRNWLATVPHGLPTDLFDFTPRQRGYLAFLGRISPEKRPDRAIEIARRSGLPLKIAAKVDAADARLFPRGRSSRCCADPLVEFVGEIGDAGKNAVPRRRRARCCSRSTGRSRSAW